MRWFRSYSSKNKRGEVCFCHSRVKPLTHQVLSPLLLQRAAVHTPLLWICVLWKCLAGGLRSGLLTCFPWRSGDSPSLRSSLWLSGESPCASTTSVCPSLCVCADRHSGCCHVLAVLILRAHALICAPVSSSSGEYLPVEWWGRTGILVSPRGPAAVFVSAAKPLCSPASSI